MQPWEPAPPPTLNLHFLSCEMWLVISIKQLFYSVMNVKCFANWKLLYPEISGYYFCSAGPAAGYREQMVHANVELLQGSVVCKCSQGSTWDVLFFGLVLSFFARIWEFLNSCLVYQSRASGWSPSRTATSHYGAREGSPGVIRSGQKWRCPCPCQAP